MTSEFDGLTILIVEDNESNILFFKSALKRTGATLFFIEDGEEAVKFIKENKDIDIILMDINLPKMDGLEATREIKKIAPKLPIIIQTAYVMDFKEKECYESGCDFFIEKPIRLTKLKEAIHKLSNKN